jgi:hypothetical protein
MSFVFNNIRPPRLGRAGITSLELALVSGLFFILVLSIVDLAWWMIISQSVTALVAEYGRACMLAQGFNGATTCTDSQAGLAALAAVAAPLLDVRQVQWSGVVQWFAPNGATELRSSVIVTVSYPYSAMTPWMQWLAGVNPYVTSSATYVF